MTFNILLPIAGNGQRFVDQGYETIKPLIPVGNQCIIEKAMESIDRANGRLIFVLRKEHADRYSLDVKLKAMFGDSISLLLLDAPTDGALSTCLHAAPLIDNHDPLVIFTPDCHFTPQFSLSRMAGEWDGAVSVFPSRSSAHSYVALDSNDLVVRAAEKEVISSHAVGGLYYFKKGSTFVHFAKEQIRYNMRTKGEFYICPVFNLLINAGMRVGIDRNTQHTVLGTPEDLRQHLLRA